MEKTFSAETHSEERVLYHYTSMRNFLGIVESGQLNTSPSCLLRPKNLHLNEERTAWVDVTDSYKPVVWLTCNPNATSEEYGNHDTIYESKSEVRISIPYSENMFYWNTWRKANHMDELMFKSMVRCMPGWRDVYVCMKPISTSDFSQIRIKTDAARRFGVFEAFGIPDNDSEFIYFAGVLTDKSTEYANGI